MDSALKDLSERFADLASLGEGGAGVVYRARHRELGRDVVIKLTLALDPEALARFEREGRVLASLRHPNLLSVHECGTARGRPYLVFDHLSGGALSERIASRGPLPWPEASRVMRDVLAGLGHAHAAGILHRDVKAANVLMAEDGRALLADFGLARPLAHGSTVTEAGTVLGTPSHMAPELLLGEGDVAADLYAAGVTLFEALTGRVPFAIDTIPALFEAHRSAPRPDPEELVTDLPRGAGALVQRAMAIDPAARFESAGAMAAAIERTGRPTRSTRRIDVRRETAVTTTIAPPVRRVRWLPLALLGTTFIAWLALRPAPAPDGALASARAATPAPSRDASIRERASARELSAGLSEVSAILDGFDEKADMRRVNSLVVIELPANPDVLEPIARKASAKLEEQIQSADRAGVRGEVWLSAAFVASRLVERLRRLDPVMRAHGVAALLMRRTAEYCDQVGTDPYRACLARLTRARASLYRAVDQARAHLEYAREMLSVADALESLADPEPGILAQNTVIGCVQDAVVNLRPLEGALAVDAAVASPLILKARTRLVDLAVRWLARPAPAHGNPAARSQRLLELLVNAAELAAAPAADEGVRRKAIAFCHSALPQVDVRHADLYSIEAGPAALRALEAAARELGTPVHAAELAARLQELRR